MAQPVWVLSVDLQAKTATFQTGLAEAARSARTSFSDIAGGAGRMGEGVQKGSLDIRHALGLVDNTIRGAHSMAMVDLIRMFQDSAVVMNAIPFAMTAAGFALVAEVVVKGVEAYQEMRQEAEKLRDAHTQLSTTVAEAFNHLDSQLLEAQKQADELANKHLAAVQTELKQIDMESMETLRKTFDDISKQADDLFGKLKTHWYEFGTGSIGAQHALDEFGTQYRNLLETGDKVHADGLLKGTLDQAKQTLQLQREANSARGSNYTDTSYMAQLKLKQLGRDFDDKAVQAQEEIVNLLTKQATAEEKVQTLKNQQQKNAVTQEGNEESARRSAAARALADSQAKMATSAMSADKALADAQNEIQQSSLEVRLQTAIEFAGRTRDVELATNQSQIAALDRAGKDYQNQLKALEEKNLEIQGEYDAKVTELRAQSSVAVFQRDLQQLQQSEREKIQATQQGSAARLAVISAAIAEEENRNLQNTDFYRELLTQRVEAARQGAEQEAQETQRTAQEEASGALRMQVLIDALTRNAMQSRTAQTLMSGNDRLNLEMAMLNREYETERAGLQKQLAALDQFARDYAARKVALNNKLQELDLQHEAQKQAAVDKSQKEELGKLTTGQQEVVGMFNQGFAQVLTGKQTFAQMMSSIDNQLATAAIQNALKDIEAGDMTREKDAATAARKAFLAGWHFPFPANIVMAPVLAAGAFAAAMAFAGGTDNVPGTGRGDTVPAMLTPGEGVVPGGVMDGLRKVAGRGGFTDGERKTTHVHVNFRPVIHAMDGASVERVLNEHGEKFTKHVTGQIRRMNRG